MAPITYNHSTKSSTTTRRGSKTSTVTKTTTYVTESTQGATPNIHEIVRRNSGNQLIQSSSASKLVMSASGNQYAPNYLANTASVYMKQKSPECGEHPPNCNRGCCRGLDEKLVTRNSFSQSELSQRAGSGSFRNTSPRFETYEESITKSGSNLSPKSYTSYQATRSVEKPPVFDNAQSRLQEPTHIAITTLSKPYTQTPTTVNIKMLDSQGNICPVNGSVNLTAPNMTSRSIALENGEGSDVVTFYQPGLHTVKAEHNAISTQIPVRIAEIPALKMTAPATSELNKDVQVQVEAVDTLGRRIPCTGPLDASVNGRALSGLKLVDGLCNFSAPMTKGGENPVDVSFGGAQLREYVNVKDASTLRKLIVEAPRRTLVGRPTNLKVLVTDENEHIQKDATGNVVVSGENMETKSTQMREGTADISVNFTQPGDNKVTIQHKELNKIAELKILTEAQQPQAKRVSLTAPDTVYTNTAAPIKAKITDELNNVVPVSGPLKLAAQGMTARTLNVQDGKAADSVTFDGVGKRSITSTFNGLTSETPIDVKQIPMLKMTAPATSTLNSNVQAQVEAVDTFGKRILCNGPLAASVDGQAISGVKLVDGLGSFAAPMKKTGENMIDADFAGTKARCAVDVVPAQRLSLYTPPTAEVGTPVPVSLKMLAPDGSLLKSSGKVDLKGDAIKPLTANMKNGVADANIVFTAPGSQTVTAVHRDTAASTSSVTEVAKKKVPWLGCEISDTADVVSVVPGGPADKANFSVGDKVLTVAKIPVSNIAEFGAATRAHAVVGEPLNFKLEKPSGPIETTIIVGDREDRPQN